MNHKVVRSADLSSECWSVQIHGRSYCNKCDLRGTEHCGGKEIRRTGKNSKGKRVPLPNVE